MSTETEQQPEAVETFTCKCGDFEYPLADDSQDESTWCECGLRIDEQRQRILNARR